MGPGRKRPGLFAFAAQPGGSVDPATSSSTASTSSSATSQLGDRTRSKAISTGMIATPVAGEMSSNRFGRGGIMPGCRMRQRTSTIRATQFATFAPSNPPSTRRPRAGTRQGDRAGPRSRRERSWSPRSSPRRRSVRQSVSGKRRRSVRARSMPVTRRSTRRARLPARVAARAIRCVPGADRAMLSAHASSPPALRKVCGLTAGRRRRRPVRTGVCHFAAATMCRKQS